MWGELIPVAGFLKSGKNPAGIKNHGVLINQSNYCPSQKSQFKTAIITFRVFPLIECERHSYIVALKINRIQT